MRAIFLFFLLLPAVLTAPAQSIYEPYYFGTLAGSGPGRSDGASGFARFDYPNGVATGGGNIYVADTYNHTVRRIDPSGVVSTLAGLAGNPGVIDGVGSAARFNSPEGIATDANGNVYVADYAGHTIRKITPAGQVSTLAGLAGSIGNADGTGSNARFYGPDGLAVDSVGNVYVADYGNSTIRKITPTGAVTTLAGLAGNTGSTDGTGSAARFMFPTGVAVNSSGTIYVADRYNFTIRQITQAGMVTTLAGSPGISGGTDGVGSAARFVAPVHLATDPSNNIFVTETGGCTVRKVTSAGVVTTFAGLPNIHGSTDGAGSAARFYYPIGVAANSAGEVYVTDNYNCLIRKITTGGNVSTFAGILSPGIDDGQGVAARFEDPRGVRADPAGNFYVADSANHTIRRISVSGLVTTVAGLPGTAGSTDGAGPDARFNKPRDLVFDSVGNLYITDSNNNTVRKITSAGVVSTFAGLADAAGSADGLGSSARFSFPIGLAVDSSDNLYVGDYNNNTIRKISPAGSVSTLAGLAGSSGSSDGSGNGARFNAPAGVVVGPDGYIYVADSINNTVRKISAAGVTTTLAGSAPTSGNIDATGNNARFYSPTGITADSVGNLYVTETGNNTIRKVTPAGQVTTVAGLTAVFNNADGSGSKARFAQPRGIAFDRTGRLLVADSLNNVIKRGGAPQVSLTISGANGQPRVLQGLTQPGQVVQILATNNLAARFTFLASVTADSQGNYSYPDLASGEFTKRFYQASITTSGQ